MIGLYEKSMPNSLSIIEKLELVKNSGFDFMELSIDETQEKLSRIYSVNLFIDKIRQAVNSTDVPILTICLSALRKYALGSKSEETRDKSLKIVKNTINLAYKTGVRIIQIPGYDVYYEQNDDETEKYFIDGLKKCVEMASHKGVTLAFEIMETPFMNTVEKAVKYVKKINSPYLQIYPDTGNVRNGTDFYLHDISLGKGHIVAAHLKETVEGVYRNMMFGEGRVDFKGFIEAFKSQGVNLFVCEFWYDGKTQPLSYINKVKTFFDGIL